MLEHNELFECGQGDDSTFTRGIRPTVRLDDSASALLSKNIVRNNSGTAVALCTEKKEESENSQDGHGVSLSAIIGLEERDTDTLTKEILASKTHAQGSIEFSGNVFCDNNGCNGPQPEELSDPPTSLAAEEEQARLDAERFLSNLSTLLTKYPVEL